MFRYLRCIFLCSNPAQTAKVAPPYATQNESLPSTAAPSAPVSPLAEAPPSEIVSSVPVGGSGPQTPPTTPPPPTLVIPTADARWYEQFGSPHPVQQTSPSGIGLTRHLEKPTPSNTALLATDPFQNGAPIRSVLRGYGNLLRSYQRIRRNELDHTSYVAINKAIHVIGDLHEDQVFLKKLIYTYTQSHSLHDINYCTGQLCRYADRKFKTLKATHEVYLRSGTENHYTLHHIQLGEGQCTITIYNAGAGSIPSPSTPHHVKAIDTYNVTYKTEADLKHYILRITKKILPDAHRRIISAVLPKIDRKPRIHFIANTYKSMIQQRRNNCISRTIRLYLQNLFSPELFEDFHEKFVRNSKHSNTTIRDALIPDHVPPGRRQLRRFPPQSPQTPPSTRHPFAPMTPVSVPVPIVKASTHSRI